MSKKDILSILCIIILSILLVCCLQEAYPDEPQGKRVETVFPNPELPGL